MSPDSDLQRPDHGVAADEPADARGTNGSASTDGGAQLEETDGSGGKGEAASQPKSVAGQASSGPELKAADRGGPASWIQAPPGMARSGDAISMADRRLARGLGWFSLGLGIPQVLMPGRINKLAGLDNTFFKRQLMRVVGLREIGAGWAY